MRTCKDIIDLLSDYLDGALAARALEDFEAHMALCAACVQYLESLRETQARVRELRCDDLPQDVHRALREFLDRATKGRRS
jgi:anti-sigma factor RsiW